MRRRLRLPPRTGDHTPMNMVVRTDDGAVSLLVDEIGDVLDMDPAAYERPPENLDPAAREIIRGVYKLKDRLLLVLDTDRTVDLAVEMRTRRRDDSLAGVGKQDRFEESGASSGAVTRR